MKKTPPEPALVPQDALTRYFAEIGQYPLLNREEEQELAVRVREGSDPEAAQQLVLSNLRLVVKIAREYQRVWTNLLDLIQEGNIGLLQAVKRFDPYRGVKLSSYSSYWIRAYILKYLIDNIRMVRVGGSRAERKLFFRLNRAKRELEQAGFTPQTNLLAESLDVKERDVEDMEQRLAQSDLSLDMPVRNEADSATLGDLMAAPGESAESEVSKRLIHESFRAHIERFSKNLDERELRILRERILADDPRTLQELGDAFGLTRERIRQLEKRLVANLREYLKENLVDFDYWAPES